MKRVVFTPLDDKLVVQQQTAEERTAGGIIIPEAAQVQNDYGMVVSAGPLVTDLKPGDLVVWGKYEGTEIVVENRSAYVISRKMVKATYRVEEAA